tara:strand:- start:224 stop:739 length:516 start_codon:yes stop_codon:yes gene_type:complete
MAKKKLILNESKTRRFMKLASVKPMYVSNFLKEAEEEEELMDAPPAEEEGMGMEADPEMDAEMEVEDEALPDEGGAPEAEGLVMDLLSKIQEFAEENGVSMELEGDEGAEEAELEGGEMELADEEALGGDEDIDADLEAADVEVADEEEIVAEVTRRVARRLLRESAKRKR